MKNLKVKEIINSMEDFNELVGEIQSQADYQQPKAFGLGLSHISETGRVLSVRFPHVNLNEALGSAAIFSEAFKQQQEDKNENKHWEITKMLMNGAFFLFRENIASHPNVAALHLIHNVTVTNKVIDGYYKPVFVPIYDFDMPPSSPEEVYLRFHLLSLCKMKPRSMNMDVPTIFKLLTKVCWTNKGAVDEEIFDKVHAKYVEANGYEFLSVHSIDKFPRLTDFIIPKGVRIAHGDKVRLGAHLAPGTTIMHSAQVNFDAGTLGAGMIEGRISSKVIVGANSDVGGGASILGTMSGGNKEVITVGENCLLGANSVLGISLGNRCKLGAGVALIDKSNVTKPNGAIVKAIELSGQDGLTFFRDDVIRVIPTKGEIQLNPVLHS